MSNVSIYRMRDFVRRWPAVAVLSAVFLLTVIWWMTIFVRGIENTPENYWFGLPQLLIPFFGGVFVILQTRKRQIQKFLCRALLFMAWGVIFWSFGTLAFLYYNVVLNVAVPYPSVADVGYCLAYSFWITGLFFLNLSLDFTFRLKTVVRQMMFFVLPFVVISVSYYLFFVVAQGGLHIDFAESPLKTFLDIAYPGYDTLIFLLLALPMYELLSGTKIPFKRPVVVLCVAFLVEYCGDLGFSYTTFRGTYFTSTWVDLLFLIAMFLIPVSLSLFVQESGGEGGVSAAAKKEVFNERV